MKKDFEWENIEKEILKINEIVEKCNDVVKEKCFQLLFDLRFGTKHGRKHQQIKEEEESPVEEILNQEEKPDYKISGNLKAFLRKNQLPETILNKLFMLDHEPILPVYKINETNSASALIQNVFMILLENAISSGNFKANYLEIRETCKEEGLWDANSAGTLKRKAKLFRGAISKTEIDESGTVELSGEGLTKLVDTIQQLGQ